MIRHITIEFLPGETPDQQQVIIEYHPETSEEGLRDRMAAIELALHALAARAERERQQVGIPVPEALVEVINARTFRELL